MKIGNDWYDVSDFADRHPGGDIILDFVGKDATDAFYAFHFRPRAVLKRVKKVGGTTDEKKEQEEEDEFSMELRAMIEGMKAEGYFELDFWFFFFKMALVFVFFAIGWGLAFAGTAQARAENDPSLIQWTSRLVPAAGCIALFLQQSGFLMHDLMHNSVTHNRKKDQILGRFFGTFCLGISATWWRDEHFIHHAFTNTLESGKGCKDVQMIEDVWAQNEKLVQFFNGSTSPRQMEGVPLIIVNTMINFQAFLWLPLCVGVGRIGIMLASFQREHRPQERALQLCHVAWMIAMLYAAFPTFWAGLLFYLMISLGQGVLHVQLLVSHYAKPWKDEVDYMNENPSWEAWHKWQVAATINIAPFFSTRPWRKANDRTYLVESKVLDYWDDQIAPIFDDWFHGGLNLHIEHHSFPTLPRNALRECARRIRPIIEKHGLLYDERHFLQGVRDTLVHMHKTGWKIDFMEAAMA